MYRYASDSTQLPERRVRLLFHARKKGIHINLKVPHGRHVIKAILQNERKCSHFVHSIERRKQLGNVAFGGNWSEELVDKDRLEAYGSQQGVVAYKKVRWGGGLDRLAYLMHHAEQKKLPSTVPMIA